MKSSRFSTQVQRWIFGSSFCEVPGTFYTRYLVSLEAGQMNRLAGIVLGEGFWLATMALGPDQYIKM